jgi:hypothetical protein
MISIDNLQLLFDADRQCDEAVFAVLFRRYSTREAAVRRSEAEDAVQAAADRSLEQRGSW